MRKSNLYLETSVFGFYYDEKMENILKREAARKLFTQIKKGFFYGLTAPLTVTEIDRVPSPYKEKLSQLIKGYGIEIVEIEESELESLFQNYMTEKIVPVKFRNDARHVACATILRVDVLVSYNLEHIANEWRARQFNAVNLREGYLPINIRMPEEVIYYEDQRFQR